MLEILVVMAVLAILMAKVRRRRGRSMAKYVKGQVEETLSLGTLAANTVVSDIFDETLIEAGIITSLVGTWDMDEWTETVGAGPIQVGLAHSDYTDAEILEWVTNTQSWDFADMIQQEVAKRRIRWVGTFAVPTALAVSTLNDGLPIKTKLNWRMRTGQSLRLWAFNQGSAAIATTVPLVHLIGHVNIFYD